jgi:hypothetical protein
MMLVRVILILGVTGCSVIAVSARSYAAALPGSVGGPAKHNAGAIIGKPILKHH